MRRIASRLVILIVTLSAAAAQALEVVKPNDNLEAAGDLAGGKLQLHLVAERAIWHPETERNPGIEIHAFRERDGPLQNPAPMVRIPEGTEVSVTIENGIPGTTLEVHGFQQRPATEERVLRIPGGESMSTTFEAGTPGTYFYWATTDRHLTGGRTGIDSQLSGAFIIDPVRGSEDTRVFVLGEWLDEPNGHTAYTINGLAWPHTTRIDTKVGREEEWRWINPTVGFHPLHLHGSFYNVVTKGDLLADTVYAPDDQRVVVTELMRQGTTMKMRWLPEYEGNWLMHCHVSGHVSPATRLAPASHDSHGSHAEEGMSGMVIGIHAEATPGLFTHTETETRHITMNMQRVPEHYDTEPGFAVGFDDQIPTVPGPPLFLTRGETVDIELVNRLGEATSVHWHGMELESYYDGVAGFSGTQRSITPPIKPGESFHAIFTPPRAGTFIYHTHMEDERQLAAGLYGPMIITEPGQPFDPAIDKLFVIGLLGFNEEREPIGFNGEANYELELKAGPAYRLRIINITASNPGFNVTLTSPQKPVTWKPLAEDGAPLPAMHQQSRQADRQTVSVGEAFDFEWQPDAGLYWVEIRRGSGEWMVQARIIVTP
jgi:FtsP/CotA-like multicopper oxidase with cupredoxin domain